MAERRSGVDLSAFEATRAAVAADPDLGVATFTTVTTWEAGARARTTARSFILQTDEPEPLGGTDAAVDPMELALAAVGTCITARTTARTFTIETDEPAPLGGTDKAIDPMELLLAAVGGCLQIGWVTHANRRGVDFKSLRIETRGEYDLSGYMALDPNLPPGFLNISYTVDVDTDADPAVLEEIRLAAENGSPVAQNVLKGTPIRSEVNRI